MVPYEYISSCVVHDRTVPYNPVQCSAVQCSSVEEINDVGRRKEGCGVADTQQGEGDERHCCDAGRQGRRGRGCGGDRHWMRCAKYSTRAPYSTNGRV